MSDDYEQVDTKNPLDVLRETDLEAPPKSAKEVIDRMLDGIPLTSILTRYKDRIAFFNAISDSNYLLTLYNNAQQFKAEMYAEEIVDIADTDVDPVRARNRIDARKWYASKIKPLKYGDRLDVNLTQTVDISSALTEARQRVRSIRDHTDIEEAQLVDTTQHVNKCAPDSKSVDPPENTPLGEKNHVDDPFD